MIHPEIVVVEYEDMAWDHDSFSQRGANSFTPMLLTVVGFLAYEDDQRIVVSVEWNNPDKNEGAILWRGLSVMPRVGIKSITRYKSDPPG